MQCRCVFSILRVSLHLSPCRLLALVAPHSPIQSPTGDASDVRFSQLIRMPTYADRAGAGSCTSTYRQRTYIDKRKG